MCTLYIQYVLHTCSFHCNSNSDFHVSTTATTTKVEKKKIIEIRDKLFCYYLKIQWPVAFGEPFARISKTLLIFVNCSIYQGTKAVARTANEHYFFSFSQNCVWFSCELWGHCIPFPLISKYNNHEFDLSIPFPRLNVRKEQTIHSTK